MVASCGVLFILLVADVARVGHAYTRIIATSDNERNQPIRFARLSSSTTLPTSIRSIQLATFASINAERDTTPSGIRFSRVPGTRLHGSIKSYGRSSSLNNGMGKTTLMATMTLIAVAASFLTQQMTIAVLSMAALLVCTAPSTGTWSIGQQIDRLVKRTVQAIVHPLEHNHNGNDNKFLLEEDDDHQKQDVLLGSSDPPQRKPPLIQFGSPSLTMEEQQHGKFTRPSSSNGKRPGGSMVLTNTTTRTDPTYGQGYNVTAKTIEIQTALDAATSRFSVWWHHQSARRKRYLSMQEAQTSEEVMKAVRTSDALVTQVMQDAEKDNNEWSVGWGIMSPTDTTSSASTTVTANTVTKTTSAGTATTVIGTSNTIRSVGASPTMTRARSITAIPDTPTSPDTGAGSSLVQSSVPLASDIAASKQGLAQQQLPQPVVDLPPARSTPHPVNTITYDWSSTQSGDTKVGEVGLGKDAGVGNKGLGGSKVGTSSARVSGQEGGGGLRPSALLSAAASSTFITPTFSQLLNPAVPGRKAWTYSAQYNKVALPPLPKIMEASTKPSNKSQNVTITMKTTAQQKEDLEWVNSVWHRARILEPTFQLNNTVFPTRGQRRSFHDVSDDDDYTNMVPEALLLQTSYDDDEDQNGFPSSSYLIGHPQGKSSIISGDNGRRIQRRSPKANRNRARFLGEFVGCLSWLGWAGWGLLVSLISTVVIGPQDV